MLADMSQEDFKRAGVVYPIPVLNQQEVNQILSGLFSYVSKVKASGKGMEGKGR